MLCAAPAGAQQPAPAEPPPGFVRMNLQGEVRLQALIDYVSERLNIQFVYNADVGGRLVTVRAPADVPVSSLLGLLSSVLRMEGFALVDAEVDGWKRIIESAAMTQMAPPGEARAVLAANGGGSPVTQVFVLEHISAAQLAQTLRPFLTAAPASNILPIPEGNVLVVTDYAANVLTVEQLIELIDRPRGNVALDFYPVQHTSAEKLAEQVRPMLRVRAPFTSSGIAAGPESSGAVELIAESRTNTIVVIAPPELVREAVELLKRFDVSLGLSTKVYRFTNVPAERVDKLAKSFLPTQDVQRTYVSTVDKDGNLMVVQATAEIHARLDELVRQLDVPVPTTDSPIRFYKLKNANALDVLYTLLALQEVAGTSSVLGGDSGAAQPAAGMSAPAGPAGTQPQGVNLQLNLTQPQTSPLANSLLATSPLASSLYAGSTGLGLNQPVRLPLAPAAGPDSARSLDAARLDRISGVAATQLAAGGTAVLPGGARVSADISTNSLIIIAPADVQQMYSGLIDSLDKRRPQVLIEAKIVAIDTSDNFSLGVEFSAGDRSGDRRAFAFDSFGLSQVNPLTGALTIIPGTGFNGTVVDSQIADVVVRALASHRRARVLAAPKILVNDNSTGQLESVLSVPFQSVNASQTVSTTSLGGDQQAGTVITVTPHINEDRHLLLEFEVEFSSFTATAAAGATLPPPRQIDRVGSTVTIPNGQTVIVGGLKRVGDAATTSGVPYIEQVPVLRELTSNTSDGRQTTSFFLFIRPQILIDDRFADLKFFSEKSAVGAGMGGEHPVSRPVMVE